MFKRSLQLAAVLLPMISGAAASAQEYDSQANDPIEPVNRAIFTFNEYADRLILKPVAEAYDFAVPDPGKHTVTNVLNNLNMPIVFVNSVLQGDPENAFSALWSFILNTTFGIGGVFDFAGANSDLRVNDEDFGQTLGAWGVGEGMYIVLPLLGPSNMRDTLGLAIDHAMDPYRNAVDNDDAAIIARIAMRVVDMRYRNLTTIDEVYETSLDPYATFRSAYTQYRRAQIENRATGAASPLQDW